MRLPAPSSPYELPPKLWQHAVFGRAAKDRSKVDYDEVERRLIELIGRDCYEAAGTQLAHAVDAHRAARQRAGADLEQLRDATRRLVDAGQALRAVELDAEPWTWPDGGAADGVSGER